MKYTNPKITKKTCLNTFECKKTLKTQNYYLKRLTYVDRRGGRPVRSIRTDRTDFKINAEGTYRTNVFTSEKGMKKGNMYVLKRALNTELFIHICIKLFSDL